MSFRLNTLTPPQMFGLVTIIFMIGSLALLSKPLFIPEHKASQVATAETARFPDDLEGLLPVSEVREMARADGPGTSVERIELEQEDGRLYYLAVMMDGSLLAYEARSGASVSTDGMTVEHEGKDPLPTNFKAVLNFAQARTVGLKEVPNGIIKKIELEVENGVVVYKVRFENQSRVNIDAMTGEIVRERPANSEDRRDVRGTQDDRHRRTDDSGSRHRDDRGGDRDRDLRREPGDDRRTDDHTWLWRVNQHLNNLL